MTYREVRKDAARILRSAGIEEADTESRLLMEYVAQTDFGGFLLREEKKMPPEEAAHYESLVARRMTRMPLQHLTGEQEFMGLPFFVNRDVLIPRQDTELLAETAIRFLRKKTEASAGNGKCGATKAETDETVRRPRVLDLCTGSGCLAVSLAHTCPEAEVMGSDISEAALSLAAKNAARNGVAVQWIRSDLFAAVEGAFDVIVCNPPYIPTAVIDTLMPEVRDFEPRTALDGGADGLAFYRRILAACGKHLRPGGWLLLEIGSEQGETVTELMKDCDLVDIRIITDLTGRDRVVTGRKKDV